jgi:hypothetical protein
MIEFDELWRLATPAAEELRWLPIAAAAVTAVLGLLATRRRRRGRPSRGLRAAILICGAGTIAATAWQQAEIRTAVRQESARADELATRLDDVRELLPAEPGVAPDDAAAAVAAAIRSLNARIADLQAQLQEEREKQRARSIDADTAARLAAYLRRFGPYRVVVSTVPDDVEAYTYANQIANILREARWEALGPETTTIFGSPPATGIRLFVRNAAAPPGSLEALTDAFTRFNIPYRSGVAPSDAIPDTATVELFVSAKS